MRSRNTLAGLAMLVVALGPASQTLWADNGPYTVQDVGPAHGVALGVNASAAVVGADGSAAPRTAFLTPFGSGPQLLAGLFAGSDDVAYRRAPRRLGRGSVDRSTSSPKPVSFQGRQRDRPGAGSAMMGAARAVNASGAIAGWMSRTPRDSRPSSGPTGTTVDLRPFRLRATRSTTAASSPARSAWSGLTSRAFTWSAGGSPTDLPSLGGRHVRGQRHQQPGRRRRRLVPRAFARRDRRAVAGLAAGVVDLGTLGGRPAARATSTTTARSSATRSTPRARPARSCRTRARRWSTSTRCCRPTAAGCC